MGENISIKEGNQGRQFTAQKLNIKTVGGGNSIWIPESTVMLDRLSVTENGVYEAAQSGLYGYSEISVNVNTKSGAGSVTGKGSDGNDYSVTVDDDGNIVETKVPSEIRIITPPDYTGPYGDGATIGFDGLTVEAFYADGSSYGKIPFEELVFPKMVAPYNHNVIAAIDSELIVIDQPVLISENKVVIEYHFATTYTITYDIEGDGYVVLFESRVAAGTYFLYYFSDNKNCAIYATDSRTGQRKSYRVLSSNRTTLINGKKYITNTNSVFYFDFNQHTLLEGTVYNPGPKVKTDSEAIGQIGTVLFDGVISSNEVSIPVQWPRPGDGELLEDSFNITVVDVAPRED